MSRNLTSYATTMLLVGSISLNLVQANKLGAFAGWRQVQPPRGATVPALHVKTLAGDPVTIDFRDQPVILYYFSPQCGWCERNWANVKALAAATAGRYRFVGLSTTADVGAYLTAHQLTFDVYTGVDAEASRMYYFGATPHTVVVARGGRVERAWAGAYGPGQQPDVERALGVALPGVLPPQAGAHEAGTFK